MHSLSYSHFCFVWAVLVIFLVDACHYQWINHIAAGGNREKKEKCDTNVERRETSTIVKAHKKQHVVWMVVYHSLTWNACYEEQSLPLIISALGKRLVRYRSHNVFRKLMQICSVSRVFTCYNKYASKEHCHTLAIFVTPTSGTRLYYPKKRYFPRKKQGNFHIWTWVIDQIKAVNRNCDPNRTFNTTVHGVVQTC